MSYFGALPSPTAAQYREAEALARFSVDKFGNSQRMILMPRSDGEAPFWAQAVDVIAAHKKNPSAKTYMIPRIMAGPENKGGMVITQSSFGVKAEDVVAVVEKFRPATKVPATAPAVIAPAIIPAATAVAPPPASTEAPSASKLPIALGVAGVALAAYLLLRRR